jgi:hypothetical protein
MLALPPYSTDVFRGNYILRRSHFYDTNLNLQMPPVVASHYDCALWAKAVVEQWLSSLLMEQGCWFWWWLCSVEDRCKYRVGQHSFTIFKDALVDHGLFSFIESNVKWKTCWPSFRNIITKSLLKNNTHQMLSIKTDALVHNTYHYAQQHGRYLKNVYGEHTMHSRPLSHVP